MARAPSEADVWAQLAVRFVERGLRMQAVENASGRPIAGNWAQRADRGTYVRNRILSALTLAGMLICVAGVVVLLFNPFIVL